MAKTIKFPTLAQMQLGPEACTDERRQCGCLLWHASRIEHAFDTHGIQMQVNSFLCSPYAVNSSANRRSAILNLRRATKRAGLRIRKDRTIVRTKKAKAAQ